MSYILDALRKSDQQRPRGAAPITLAAQTTVATPKQPAFPLNGLLAAVLVGAGILIGWLRPWQSEQAVPALAPVAVQPLAASPRPAASPPIPVLPENFAEPGHETLVQKPTPAKQAANPSGNAEVTANTPESSKTKMPTDKAFVTDPAHTEPEHRVTDITELPPSLQQEIPNLSISLHSYVSAPKDRLVMINNTLLRQGEFLAPGLRLEQITSDGVVISYKNYQFHRGVR